MPARKLESRVAVVTGASRGIGQAIALGFACEGAAVAVTARTESALKSLVERIRGMGGKAIAIPADLAQTEAPQRIVEQT